MAVTGEIRCTVTGRRAASRSTREGRFPLRVGGSREPRSGPPAGTGSAALATVLPRASAAVWPGAGVRVRLPAPPPRKRSHLTIVSNRATAGTPLRAIACPHARLRSPARPASFAYPARGLCEPDVIMVTVLAGPGHT
jgi:hypothetical protein